MGRAKIMVDIKRFEDTTNMSTIRVRNGASNGICVVAERFDESELVKMFDYTITCETSKYVSTCVDLAEANDYIAVGLRLKEKFKAERVLKYYVADMLPAPYLQPFFS
jgi:hypothetical protein